MASVSAEISAVVEPAAAFAGTLSRALRVVVSLLLILAAYWLYSWTVVPLVEPPAERQDDLDAPPTIPTLPSLSGRSKDLEKLFHEGDWQRKDPKILDNDNGRTRLLFQSYRNYGNGRITITPCCIIYIPQGKYVNDDERLRRAIIMDAPEGARLQFDRPFQPSRADLGRLQSGELKGWVTIRSKGRATGSDDELRIVTQDIKLKDRDVTTLAPVDFRMGPSYGRGQDLHIRFLPAEGSSGGTLNFGGLDMFELRHLDRLHLEKDKTAARPATQPVHARTAASPVAALGSDMPAEVSCRGPFRFFMDRQAATFEDQVSVLGINPQGPCDQLTCDVLTVFFVDGRAPAPKGPGGKAAAVKGPPAITDLVARRLDAVGSPVIVDAPGRGAQARAQHLEYDLKTGSVVLTSPDESWLRQRTADGTGFNEIHAPRLQYDPAAEQGRIGRAVADGPGWFHGLIDAKRPPPSSNSPHGDCPNFRLSENGTVPFDAPQSSPPTPPRPVEARWTKQMFIRPQGDFQVVSLTGGAMLASEDTGRLEAREVHFWLKDLPPQSTGGQRKLEPDRMLAVGNVWLEAKQLSARVEHMEVWFERRGPGHDGANPPARQRKLEQLPPGSPPRATDTKGWHVPERSEGRGLQTLHALRRPPLRVGARGRATQTGRWQLTALRLSADGTGPFDSPPQVQSPDPPASHYEVRGRVLRALMILPDDNAPPTAREPELGEAIVEENVTVVETQTAKPEDKPLLVTGDWLHAIAPKSPQGSVAVIGRPAHFEARGRTLTGGNINLNRGTNRLWVDGPGQMTVPNDGNSLTGENRPQNPPPAPGGTVKIDWRDAMNFDGRTARFEGSAAVASPEANLQTETLEVRLLDRIDFADEKRVQGQGQQTQIEQILCRGGVRLESHTVKDQQLVSVERMQAADLAVNQINGELRANGPGWLARTSRGSADPMAGRRGPGRPAAPPPQSPRNDNELTGAVVHFRSYLSGNIHQRRFFFDDDIRAAYAPVTDWKATLDPDHPELLGPKGATLTSDHLWVEEKPATPDLPHPMGAEAVGNVVIESQTLTGRAARASYDQSKDLLILEGDGRTEAHLWRQTTIGGQTSNTSAQRILYWPQTKWRPTDRVEAENIGQLNVPQFPAGSPGKR